MEISALPERFRQKVRISTEHFYNGTPCWELTGATSPNGYGGYYVGGWPGKRIFVGPHRFSYEQLVGPIPPDWTIDHLCRNSCCVNPTHLEPVTVQENLRRRILLRISHCSRGHELTAENTYVRPNGKRECRTCQRLRGSKWTLGNREKLRLKARDRRASNRELDRRAAQKRYWKDPEKYRDRQRGYRSAQKSPTPPA